MTDWSAVFLNDVGGRRARRCAAAGLTAFSLAMALGRLAGDGLAERFGAAADASGAGGGRWPRRGLGLALAPRRRRRGIAGLRADGRGAGRAPSR